MKTRFKPAPVWERINIFKSGETRTGGVMKLFTRETVGQNLVGKVIVNRFGAVGKVTEVDPKLETIECDSLLLPGGFGVCFDQVVDGDAIVMTVTEARKLFDKPIKVLAGVFEKQPVAV